MFCRSLGFCNVEVEDWKAKGNQAYYFTLSFLGH